LFLIALSTSKIKKGEQIPKIWLQQDRLSHTYIQIFAGAGWCSRNLGPIFAAQWMTAAVFGRSWRRNIHDRCLGLVFAPSRAAATTLLYHCGIFQIDHPSISHGVHHTRLMEGTKRH
jgi:hypothetical protein